MAAKSLLISSNIHALTATKVGGSDVWWLYPIYCFRSSIGDFFPLSFSNLHYSTINNIMYAVKFPYHAYR